ncbi:MAG: autotransporter strand-loop-strand O-heptosyltransferase [Candidatus Asgardarchaeia archaeon]
MHEGKNVQINLLSNYFEEVFRWCIQAVEYKKEHDCKLFIASKFNDILKTEMIDIDGFIECGEVVNDCYISYDIERDDDDLLGDYDDTPKITKSTVGDGDIKVIFNFINGAYMELKSEDQKLYKFEFKDAADGSILYSDLLMPNHWARPNRKYFTEWLLSISTYDTTIFEHKFNLSNKRVLISFDSKSLGDNIGWLPQVEEFRKKHECHVILSTFWNKLFEDQYPEIEFIDPDSPVQNLYAQYTIGCWDNDLDRNKEDWRRTPIPKIASDILGLEYKEIRSKITIPSKPRNIKDKYVCIGIHATAQCKYWNYPDGWQKVIDYLNKKGYEVVFISKEEGLYMGNVPPDGIINKTGPISIEDRIIDLKYADMFIGISSGLSWLSWAIGTPTILISGCTTPFNEFESGVERIHNSDVCNGCMNDEDIIFDRGDWYWCPHKKDFECTTTITPDMVIERIDKIIGKNKKKFSAIIPHRGIDGVDNLLSSLNNLFSLADNPDEVEAFIRLDEDDVETIDKLNSNPIINELSINIITGPRFGYQGLFKYQNELAAISEGDFILCYGGDFSIKTKGWDSIIKSQADTLSIIAPVVYSEKDGERKRICANLAPIVGRKIYEILGHLSLSAHTDSYMEDVGYLTGSFIELDIDVVYADVEKNKKTQETIKEYYEDEMTANILSDANKIINYKEKNGIKFFNRPIFWNCVLRDGPYVKLKGGNPWEKYLVEFINRDNNKIIYSTKIGHNQWAKALDKKCINWLIRLHYNEREHEDKILTYSLLSE